MKKTTLALIVITLFSAGFALAQQVDPAQMNEKLDFLEGTWKLKMDLLDGTYGKGEICYKWVLGKSWMRIDFVGKRPDGRPWEAYGMQKYDSGKGCYVSNVYFGPGDPVTYTGKWIDGKTLRVELELNGRQTGIDYIDKDDGTILQENWFINDEGERVVVLKTDYSRVE